jgi:hypothetical protein
MVQRVEPTRALPNAVDRLTAEWESAGKPYYRVEREYFSTGGVRFVVDNTTPIAETGTFQRYIMKAASGQRANLFSYKSGDPGTPANMLTNAAAQGLITDDSHTNLRVGYQTNGEDFAVMGVSFRVKGVRLELQAAINENQWTNVSAAFRAGLLNGSLYVFDVSSDILPPEVSSPLLLEDNFGRSIAKVLDMRELWNQKQGDQISLADSLGPGGGESYLHALGEPCTWNYRKLSKGLIWRNAGTANSEDTQFALQCSTLEDIWQKVTWAAPNSFPDTTGGHAVFPNLLAINVDYKVTLHGVAFYPPSENR